MFNGVTQAKNRTANAGRSGHCARSGERLKQIAFRADDADIAISDLDALSEGAEMVAAIAATVDPNPLSRRCWRTSGPSAA
jgi:hypothetical protein